MSLAQQTSTVAPRLVGQSRAGKVRSHFARLMQICIGGVFLWMGVSKLQQPYEFLASVYNYELVGPSLGLLVAMILPWMELVVGASLVVGACAAGATLLSIAMLACFTVAVACPTMVASCIGLPFFV